MSNRQRIAEELLRASLDKYGFAPCPGVHLHTGKSGWRDFMVQLDGAPTAYCVHQSCLDVVAEFNLALRRAIWADEQGDAKPTTAWGGPPTAAEPKAELNKRPKLDRTKVGDFIRSAPTVDHAWLERRSPIDVRTTPAQHFLDVLYRPDERVLVFTNHRSQGDFLHWRGHGSYRLSQDRGVKATRSILPAGGPDGVWFLTQPVSGQWAVNTKLQIQGEDPKWTRRSEVNVTGWRYFVLESDEPDFEVEWLRVLVMCGLPISAIYTSGRRSIHALVKWEVASKAEWDQARNIIREIMCPLGADPAALSAVRLSRLPGCRRKDQMQRLLWLNSNPEPESLTNFHELRN